MDGNENKELTLNPQTGRVLSDTLRLKLRLLPDTPGVYLMKQGGKIIYVGKAISLKRRVRQYFQSREQTPKVRHMVEKIEDFDTILCDTELEALILECNLIKQYQPHYNILLKDDKHYPYIRVNMKQPFARVELARRIEKDGARYFGPYIGAGAVREVLEAARNVFPLRTCTRDLSRVPQGRPCLQYEMGNCLGPCTGKVSQAAYSALLKDVVSFLSGNQEEVLSSLNQKMQEAVSSWNFEKAAVYRDRIRDVTGVIQKQKAISTSGEDQDVLYVLGDGVETLVQVLVIRGGKLLGSDAYSVFAQSDADTGDGEEDGETMGAFLLQYYEDVVPHEILVNALPKDLSSLLSVLEARRGGKVLVHVPQRGEKKMLLEMAEKNAQKELDRRKARFASEQARTVGALQELADALGLDRPPRRIEGYDISNTQGVLSVASMVVMLHGQPAHKEYRHFRIKTVEGPNDFASMREVIYRRFTHAMEEGKKQEQAPKEEARGLNAEPSFRKDKQTNDKLSITKQNESKFTQGKFTDLPDLVLIDGGAEQLAFALEGFHASGFPYEIPFFGLAKRFEEIVLPNQEETLFLDRHSQALRLLQRLRDEAHRFAITHHRKLRTKNSIRSRLEEIPLIGPSRRRALLTHFKSISLMKEATLAQLKSVPGMNQVSAENLYRALHKDEMVQNEEEKKAQMETKKSKGERMKQTENNDIKSADKIDTKLDQQEENQLK